MRKAKRMPQDDVRVVDRGVRTSGFNPRRQAVGWFTRGLGYVATGGVNLVIGVFIWKLVKQFHYER